MFDTLDGLMFEKGASLRQASIGEAQTWLSRENCDKMRLAPPIDSHDEYAEGRGCRAREGKSEGENKHHRDPVGFPAPPPYFVVVVQLPITRGRYHDRPACSPTKKHLVSTSSIKSRNSKRYLPHQVGSWKGSANF